MAIISDSWKFDILTILVGVITLLYFFFKRTYSYWDRKGFKSVPNVNFFFGNLTRVFLQKESLFDTIDTLYKLTNEPFIGIYTAFRPVLLVRDPKLIQSIFIKDFSYFTDRSIHCNEDYDPLSANLLTFPGQKWKKMRKQLTPLFTAGKLKAMFSNLVNCGSTLQNYLAKLADKSELLNVCEISASYTTNAIASVAFGLDVDAIKNPNDDFRVCGRKLVERSLSNAIRFLMAFTAPKLMGILRIKLVIPEVESFIKSIVEQNLEYREKNNINRKDFFQLMIQLRNNDTVPDTQWETVIQADGNQNKMSINEIAAQSFLFFFAGFETSSSALSFCLYELAKNPEIQKRVHEEIDTVLDEHDGNITYDSISAMKYLNSCIDGKIYFSFLKEEKKIKKIICFYIFTETLRKYFISPMISRICVKQYQIPGTNQVIEKGMELYVPVFSLHRDEKYYEDPHTFNPDRFNEDNSMEKNQINRPYYAFGDGPRNCIGVKLGKMQTKVGLALMLHKHKFHLEDRLMNRELTFSPKTFFMSPLEELKLHVSKR